MARDSDEKCKLKLLSIACNRSESQLIECTTISLIDINFKFRNLLLLWSPLPYAVVRLMYIFVNHVLNFPYCALVRYSLFSTYLSYVLIPTKRLLFNILTVNEIICFRLVTVLAAQSIAGQHETEIDFQHKNVLKRKTEDSKRQQTKKP